MLITIRRSSRKGKKFVASDGNRRVHFGAEGYEDYTTHKDPERRKRYIDRHRGEDWTRSGVMTPGWLSRYILWEKPTLRGAVDSANTM
jgi:hypothetical protein